MWTDALVDGAAAATAAIIVVAVGYLVRRRIFARARPSNLIAFILLCLVVGGVLSFLVFNALVYEEAYGMGRGDRGRRYPVSGNPIHYWFIVAFCYCGAVAAWSFGIAASLRFLKR